MTSKQIARLIQTYADFTVEMMDVRSLITCATEAVTKQVSSLTEDELLNELKSRLGEDLLQDMVRDAMLYGGYRNE